MTEDTEERNMPKMVNGLRVNEGGNSRGLLRHLTSPGDVDMIDRHDHLERGSYSRVT